MACNVGRILHALLWILLNATFIGCQQNAAITASKTSLIEGEPLTLTCIYTGIKNESAILWYNKTIGNFLALKPNSSMSNNCSFFSKGPSFESSRVAYTCDFTKNIYTLAIASVQVEDGGLWFCTFQDPFAGSPTSNIILQVNATTTTSTTTTTKPTTGTTTTTTTTVTSSSTSMSSATSSVTIDNTSTNPTRESSASATSSTSSSVTIHNTSTNPTTNGSAASATVSTSTSVSPTAVSPANNTNNISTSTNPTSNGSKSSISDTDIKVIVPAVVVPCGLLIIGGTILLVVLCVRRRARKNVRESPDGMAVQDKGNNIDGWKQSLGHSKAIDNLDAVYTTPDGFIIYPGPAAMSTARSYKDKNYHDVKEPYSRPYPGTHHHQAAYVPSTYTSARAYTHKDKKHHGVTDQYSRPSAGTFSYQAAYVPSTYKSARTYPHKGKNYDYEGPIHQPASHQMATSRLAYDQTAHYPQTRYYGHSGEDMNYSGGGQFSYGQMSRSHHDHSGRKQQKEYYNQYEMADYGRNRAGYRHGKQDTAFYY